MTMVSSGPISLAGTATSGGLNQSIEVELGGNGSTQISLDDPLVRGLLGKPSGTISLSDAYGKDNSFSFTISASATNVSLYTAAIAAGWNGNARVFVTIDNGVTIYSTTTGSAALIISSAFPNGVNLTNNGKILGAGGTGGSGGSSDAGGSGFAGGIGLSTVVATSITNNGIISGGGGGGGGGGGQYALDPCSGAPYIYGGGGGGGGTGNGTGGSGGSGNQSGSSGNSGTLTAGGSGGVGAGYGYGGGNGGTGGSYGAAGSNGAAGYPPIYGSAYPGGAGGAAGACVSGNSNITWLVTGTRYGALT